MKRLNDKIKIYKDKHKKQLLLPNPKSEDPDTLIWDLSDEKQRKNFLSVRDNLWIEGYAVSKNSGDTGLQLTYRPIKPLSGGVLQDIIDTMKMTVVKVESIEVTCDKAENSPVTFLNNGIQNDFIKIDVENDIKDNVYNGKHLLIYHAKVRDKNNKVVNFNINLKATIFPSIHLPDYIKRQMKWSVFKWPKNNSGKFDKDNELEVNYRNSKEGGVYEFIFKLFRNGPEGKAIALFPLAGAEIKEWVKNELKLLDVYVNLYKKKVKNKYMVGERAVNEIIDYGLIAAAADWTGEAKGNISPIRAKKHPNIYTTNTICNIVVDTK